MMRVREEKGISGSCQEHVLNTAGSVSILNTGFSAGFGVRLEAPSDAPVRRVLRSGSLVVAPELEGNVFRADPKGTIPGVILEELAPQIPLQAVAHLPRGGALDSAD